MTRTPHALLATAFAALLASTSPQLAQAQTPAPAASASSTALVDGEVRKIDPAQGKVTLKHGDIKHLDMPSMTMVFGVSDKAQLANLKPGDKVKFTVISDNGKLVITQIQPAP